MIRRFIFALPLLALVSAAPARAATYGETLLVVTAHRHAGVSGIAIDATGAGGTSVHVAWGQARGATTTLELTNALGEVIGRVTVSGRAAAAAAVAHDLSRHLYTVATLGEPDPFVPGAVRSARGQALVEHMLARHPGLVTLALHVALPGRENQIIASNFGRIGKAADKDDAHVIADGAILKEPTNGGRRLAVELPLLDRTGHTIGALSTSFLVGAAGPDAAYTEAIAVRDELARAIASVSTLQASAR